MMVVSATNDDEHSIPFPTFSAFLSSLKLNVISCFLVWYLIAVQSHYDSELDVLEEYLARIERSILVRQSSSGGGSSDGFESHLERTASALSNSLPQVLLGLSHVRTM